MITLSPAASLAWRLAATEAVRARQRRIEREALFIGLCALGPWLRTRTAEGAALAVCRTTLPALRAEAEEVEDVLWALGLSPVRTCQAVRTAVGRGAFSHPARTKVHRGPACRAIFQRAAALPAAVQAGELRCLHLLAALMEDPGPVLAEVLATCGVTVSALRTRLMAMPWRQEARHLSAERPAQGVSHLIYMGAGVAR